jgi:hypothetical protein
MQSFVVLLACESIDQSTFAWRVEAISQIVVLDSF